MVHIAINYLLKYSSKTANKSKFPGMSTNWKKGTTIYSYPYNHRL